MTENELDALASTQVGDPVPGEHALDADDEIVAIGRDGFEEVLRSGPEVLVEPDFAIAVEDAQVHGLGVQVDPAVMLVGVDVELHGSLLEWFGCTNQPTPIGVGTGGGLNEYHGLAADRAPRSSNRRLVVFGN